VQYLFDAIGVVRSPFQERAEAPRQASVARAVAGRIELLPGKGFEDALEGLDAWDYAWVLFVFHANVAQGRGWRPKVQPPRAEGKVGVFATRSPHRPNPIGLTSVRVERVDGLVVYVRELDLLDGTPVVDLKPYVPYADAHPDARSGWLEAKDPRPTWEVSFSADAVSQLAWLKKRGVDPRAGIEAALALGPQPHAYRRIRRHSGGLRLAIKEWRVDFTTEGPSFQDREARGRIVVSAIRSGYRPRQLASDPGLALHRDFVAEFGG
jgi:tRNA-Thr(GGU) m(6)t(6)A37 methyltransferase TsaA